MTGARRSRYPPGYQPNPHFSCLLATGCAGLAILSLVGLLLILAVAVGRLLPGALTP